MPQTNILSPTTVLRDLLSGVVVFLVALPLCLGVALASNAPLISGILAGIIGGVLVGIISKSHTSVSGPAAGLTAIVAAQITALGSFEAFLLAVFIAGLIQVILGLMRAGFIAGFFPSSVIQGLLAAIGIILILKQIPHVLGHDDAPEGVMSFNQPDHQNTFSELLVTINQIHLGAMVIGLTSIVLLVAWDRLKPLKKTGIPASLLVVFLGVALNEVFLRWGGQWAISGKHLVQVPVAESVAAFTGFLRLPDFTQWSNPLVYKAAFTIALVASLETLINLEAVDRLDPKQRISPPSRELFAQGVGNMAAGLVGGIPVTSVIVRSSVNINSGAQTKLSTLIHGMLLAISVIFLPQWLNKIPLSALAAILLVTGFKLASPTLMKQMWRDGRNQFLPFIITVVAIVFTDLLVGILIGLLVSMSFILSSNFRRPIHRFVEKHLGGDVLHIVLDEQVSFFKRAAMEKVLDEVPRGGHVLLDAQNTNYIDPDVLHLIRDYVETRGPARGLEISLRGFRDKYDLQDHIQYVDYSTRELQSAVTPVQVLEILRQGHLRFQAGNPLNRDLSRQVTATATGQHPLAVILGCIDSRAPTELIFDLGVGDAFTARVAGNISSRKILASIEYACAVAGAKLILVLGHTRCGAVTTAVNLVCSEEPIAQLTGCQHVEFLLKDIQHSLDPEKCQRLDELSAEEREKLVNEVARKNVLYTVERIQQESGTVATLVQDGKIAIVGAMYDVVSGKLDFLEETLKELQTQNS